MKFRIIPGKNLKTFVYIEDVHTKEDLELYDIIIKVLSRTEFMPFMQGFNKTISYSYLFNDFLFPIQFLPDVLKQLNNFSSKKIEVVNEQLLVNNEIDLDEFEAWISTLKFPDFIDTVSEDYQYQRDAVFLAIKHKIGRIDVSVSGGKTFITYLYCRYLFEFVFGETKKMLIVVPSKLLCNQLKKDFKTYDTYFERPLGVETVFSGAKRLLDADVICGTFQTLSQYDQEYFDDFGVFVCDEVHRAKSYSIRNEIYNKLLNCEYFFGMTGTTPEYKTLDYLHIVSMFGPALVIKEAYEIIESGVATPVRISMIKINYLEDGDFSKNLKAAGITGTERLKIEKEYFHTNEKRTEILGKLLNAVSGNSLILVNTVEYCHILHDFLCNYCPDWNFEIIHGEVKNREDIIEEMRMTPDKYCIIATTETMSTGVSINNLQNGYLADGGKSERRIGQSIGRLMRLFEGKKISRLFDLWDDMDRSIYRSHALFRKKYYEIKKFPVKITETSI
jgi:superfamily II DNA or RNA helicase